MASALAINELSHDAAREALLRCCGSRAWVETMLDRRPFANDIALFAAADEVWNGLHRHDILEAFAAHPRIGDIVALRKKFAATAQWCANEQAGVGHADDAVLHQLAEGNHEYEHRFGHIFIVCATGKTAAEMLAILLSRLHNDPEAEFRIAAAEQAKITRLRLEKL